MSKRERWCWKTLVESLVLHRNYESTIAVSDIRKFTILSCCKVHDCSFPLSEYPSRWSSCSAHLFGRTYCPVYLLSVKWSYSLTISLCVEVIKVLSELNQLSSIYFPISPTFLVNFTRHWVQEWFVLYSPYKAKKYEGLYKFSYFNTFMYFIWLGIWELT